MNTLTNWMFRDLSSEGVRDAAAVSDGQLLRQLALVLDGCSGPVLGPRLSTLVAHVCHASCPAKMAGERAEDLELLLAGWLNTRRVLRSGQMSPAGLDEWAADAAVVFLRAAVRACELSLDPMTTSSVPAGSPVEASVSEVTDQTRGGAA